MAMDETARRRWFGVIVLATALGLLVLGETVLKDQLRLRLLAWALCLVCTSLAIMAAFRDLRALQRRTQREHRNLLDATLKEIEQDAKTREEE